MYVHTYVSFNNFPDEKQQHCTMGSSAPCSNVLSSDLPQFQSLIEFPPNIQEFKQTIEDAQIHTVCQGVVCFKNLEKLKLAHGHFLKLFEEQVEGLSYSDDGKNHLKFAKVFKEWMKDLPKILNIKSDQFVKISKLFDHTIKNNEQKFNELYLKLTQSSGSVTRVTVSKGTLNIASSIHSKYLPNVMKFSNALLDQDETKIGLYMQKYHELLKEHFRNGDAITIEDLSFDEDAEFNPFRKYFFTIVVVSLLTVFLLIICQSSENQPRRIRPAAPPG